MPLKIILYTEKTISDKISHYSAYHSNDFEITYIADSYKRCIDKLIQLKADVVIFQLVHPIYKVQDFFIDLAAMDFSPILVAFTAISEKEIAYSITSHNDSVFFNKLKDFFTEALQDTYYCQFNYIGENKDSNLIMNSRIKKLEKTEYMNDILRGVTEDEFNYYKKKASLNLKDSGYYLYFWNLTEIEYVDHDLNKNIYYLVGEMLVQECEEVLNLYNGGEVFYLTPTLLCIIINNVSFNSQAAYQQTLRELTSKLNTVLSCKSSFRYRSSYMKYIQDIRLAYESFYHLKIYNFFCREADLLTFDYINSVKKDIDHNAIDELHHELKEIIHNNIADPKLVKLIQKLFIDLIKPSLSYDLYYYSCTFLSAVITEKFRNIYHNKLPNNYSPRELFYSSIEQKCSEFIESIHLLKGELSNRYMVKSPVVLQVIDFIHEHYRNDVSIYLIAEKLNISHSYLTQIFTKEMGINPRKYLITYRIQKAKEMITSSDELVYSIALNVGFFDVKHFSKTFKKITGLTPMQYKKQYSKVEYV